MQLTQAGKALIRRVAVLGLSTLSISFFATTGIVGCGDDPANPPFNAEVAKKVSAKYKELHPEEFPAPKAKASRKRRGG